MDSALREDLNGFFLTYCSMGARNCKWFTVSSSRLMFSFSSTFTFPRTLLLPRTDTVLTSCRQSSPRALSSNSSKCSCKVWLSYLANTQPVLPHTSPYMDKSSKPTHGMFMVTKDCQTCKQTPKQVEGKLSPWRNPCRHVEDYRLHTVAPGGNPFLFSSTL